MLPNLRGTIQADVLKEVQAQNEMIFPIDASLRFLARHGRVHHPAHAALVSRSPSAATTSPRPAPRRCSRRRTRSPTASPTSSCSARADWTSNEFGPRLSFFLDCGLDVEYLALARVCRKIWAIGMRDVFGADERAQRFKLHTQTSGRSLIAHDFKNNLTRTAVELMLAYINATNSCHSNSADEPFTTPAEEYVRLAAQAQAILLEESGLFKAT